MTAWDHPELFPAEIANGYWLHRQRALKETQPYHSTNQTGEHPSGYQMRPFCSAHGWPDRTVEKKPYLRRFGYP